MSRKKKGTKQKDPKEKTCRCWKKTKMIKGKKAQSRSRKKKGKRSIARKKKETKTKNWDEKGAKHKDQKNKTCRCWRKTKVIKGKKSQDKAREKRKYKRNKGRHGDAYYFNCFNAATKFVSRLKKASNLLRQAKRIIQFRQITNNKLAKVRKT